MSAAIDERLDSSPRMPPPRTPAPPPPVQVEPAQVEPASMPLAGVEAELCRLAGQIAAATCRFLLLLGDFDARQGWAGVNIRSCAHWLSWRCGLDLRTAREHLRVARAMRDLPGLSAAFGAGRLSYSKVRAIARVATPETEDDLVQAGLHATAAQVERLTRGLETAQRYADEHLPPPGAPPGTPPTGPKGSSPGAGAASSKRRLRTCWRWDDDGTFVFWGRLSPEDGAFLLAAATRADAERHRTDQVPDLDQPSDADQPANTGQSTNSKQRVVPPSDLGPALTTMALMVCSALPAPVHAPAAQIVVQVDADTLLGAITPTDQPAADQPAADQATEQAQHQAGAQHQADQGHGADDRARSAEHQHEPNDQRRSASQDRVQPNPGGPRPAHLDGGPALTPAILRRLSCDGRLRAAIIAGDGRTLNLGRSRRTVSDKQFEVLWRRDRGCALPGCGRTRFLHAHHVQHWADGGATDLDNLVLLCGEHHRTLHEGAFTIQAHGRQQFTFHHANGLAYHSAPATRGTLNDLTNTHQDVQPDTIVPDWDGSPLRLHWAVGAYLDAWRANQARRATQASEGDTASHSDQASSHGETGR